MDMAIRLSSGLRVHGRGPVARGRIQEALGSGVETGRNSEATAERIFTGLFNDLVRQTPKAGDSHPDFPGLTVDRKRITPLKGGRGEARIIYRGPDPALNFGQRDFDPETNPEGNITEPEEEIETITTEEPIETHPNFAALVLAAGTGEGQATFDEDGLFLGFGPNSGGGLAGVQSYFVRRTVTRTTVLARQKLNANEAATREAGGLVTKLNSTRTGKAWKNVKEVTSGSWNSLVYPG
jgi:hypothetical protein